MKRVETVKEVQEKSFYDLDELKAIPIEEICEAYGIKVYKHNNSLWFSIRDEQVPSVKIYRNTNTFCDFGNTQLSGDGIRLVAIIEKVSNTSAIKRLADIFGIKPINAYDFNQDYDLTNRQYARINIQADVALKNMDSMILISLPENVLHSAYDTLNVPMATLRKTNPQMYHLLLRDKSLPYLKEMRNDYFKSCFIQDQLCHSLKIDIFKSEIIMRELENIKNQLEEAEKILFAAIDDKTLLTLKSRIYDVEKDVLGIRSGKINFEFGKTSYDKMKEAGKELVFLNVSIDDYFENMDKISQNHAIFYNRGSPKLVCLKDDLRAIENIFQTQQTKMK